MSDPVIELVKLENGDIALRNAESPDEHLLTITFSDPVKGMLQFDQMEVARAMVEAGMDSFREIQVQRIKEVEAAVEAGRLH
jgi:hypothetical protein